MPSFSMPRRAALLCAALVFGGGFPAIAGTDIQPPFVTVTASQPAATITVTNDRTVPAGYDIEAVGWEQKPDGEVLLPPTSGIRVNPGRLDIPAHGSGQVRVTALAAAPRPGEAEKVYRVRIRERSDRRREPSEKQVQMIATITLPVFQRPPAVAALPRVEARPVEDGRLGFAVVNAGTGHTYVREATVTGRDAAGRQVFAIRRHGWYVLAHGRLEFTAALAAADCRQSRTIAIAAYALDGGAVWRATLTPDPRRCGHGTVSGFPRPGMATDLLPGQPGQPPPPVVPVLSPAKQ